MTSTCTTPLPDITISAASNIIVESLTVSIILTLNHALSILLGVKKTPRTHIFEAKHFRSFFISFCEGDKFSERPIWNCAVSYRNNAGGKHVGKAHQEKKEEKKKRERVREKCKSRKYKYLSEKVKENLRLRNSAVTFIKREAVSLAKSASTIAISFPLVPSR